MNTNQLKLFAQKARIMIRGGVSRQLRYWGFDDKGNVECRPEKVEGGVIHREEVMDDPGIQKRWEALHSAVRHQGFDAVVEEAAYTWFNRLVAIRILAKNGYDLPQLEYGAEGSQLPQLLQRARRGQYSFLSADEQKRLKPILADYTKETQAFAILLIGYCHSNALLNNVFGRLDDYTELLLPADMLNENGFIHFLNITTAISDDDYKKVELIGWLYQFYISEKKDEVFRQFKKNKKAEAKDIPAATQIFTPNWIVKYMVENTVGKIWLDKHPDSPLKEWMKYLVERPEQPLGDPLINEVSELKLLDPAVGSGHILVEGFDLLYAMYEEEYYMPEEAVESILRNNLFGLDIDLRAAQLARFALLMKAASKYPGILQKNIMPRVYAMPEPAPFSRQEVLDFLGTEGLKLEDKLSRALQLMQQAQNLGSTMQFEFSEAERVL
ncbi:MAG: class I SAM-dependent DNA methyltransferase, partial [Paludibacter sp.]